MATLRISISLLGILEQIMINLLRFIFSIFKFQLTRIGDSFFELIPELGKLIESFRLGPPST